MTKFFFASVLLLTLLVPEGATASGRKPLTRLTKHQQSAVSKIGRSLPKREATELAAIGLVESGLKSTVSKTGDYGPMQVNCRVWRRLLKEQLGILSCEQEVMDLKVATRVADFIVKRLRRKYPQCRGTKVYSCYNGGQGWAEVQQRCKRKCKRQDCSYCDRPVRYAHLVRQTIRLLRMRYSALLP